jgi:transcriptional regulator with PAS, ATPase and Fis domain
MSLECKATDSQKDPQVSQASSHVTQFDGGQVETSDNCPASTEIRSSVCATEELTRGRVLQDVGAANDAEHDLVSNGQPVAEPAPAADIQVEQVSEAYERALPLLVIKRPESMHGVVGSSAPLIDVFSVVDRVADTDCTVLITGESGTGKELVARGVHSQSPRRGGPFVAVNCGAIPEALLESELFGHARGAFTGAHQTKMGRIGMADHGTLFLDEIGELSLGLQVKLLRVLQSREYSPVGDTRVLKADVRVVAATNMDLEKAVAEGNFRQDLYYRLNVIMLHVPELKRRTSDIPELVDHFMASARQKTGRMITQISRAAMQLLMDHSWPGNVRELENTIERAMLLCPGDRIEPTDLPVRVRGLGTPGRNSPKLPDAGIDLRAAVESYENDLIRQALDRTGWNKNRAANLLKLNRTTLVEMMKRKRIAPRAA